MYRAVLLTLVVVVPFFGVYQCCYGRKVLGAVLLGADLAFCCSLLFFPELAR